MMNKMVYVCLCLLWPAILFAQDLEPRYFYRGLNYGSETLVNPVTMILHGGYGILQAENRTSFPDEIDYRTGAKNVWTNLRHPLRMIKEYGTEDFIIEQFLPLSADRRKAYYWPNYTTHLIGGGMSYRMMVEWYQAHGIVYAKPLAITTIMTYHYLNEIVENNGFVGNNTDPIADLLFFDPLSIVLFSSEDICRFFSETFSLSEWAFQFSVSPHDGGIQNQGQNFMMRYSVPYYSSLNVIYLFGNHGQLGLSWKKNSRDYISLTYGYASNRLVELGDDERILQLGTELVPMAGIYYDRNRSLMFSFIYTQRQDHLLRLNLYPGFKHWQVGNYRFPSPGLFLLLERDRGIMGGITFGYLPVQIMGPGF
jgi:hypothetical protein